MSKQTFRHFVLQEIFPSLPVILYSTLPLIFYETLQRHKGIKALSHDSTPSSTELSLACAEKAIISWWCMDPRSQILQHLLPPSYIRRKTQPTYPKSRGLCWWTLKPICYHWIPNISVFYQTVDLVEFRSMTDIPMRSFVDSLRTSMKTICARAYLRSETSQDDSHQHQYSLLFLEKDD